MAMHTSAGKLTVQIIVDVVFELLQFKVSGKNTAKSYWVLGADDMFLSFCSQI